MSPTPADPGELRRTAEARLRERKSREPAGPADVVRLLHELEVHELELEMQNEELREARREIEAGLRRYTELFDFAPIGYFVLDAESQIGQLNLAAARLLGSERARLEGAYLDRWVPQSQLHAFRTFVGRVLTSGAEDTETATCDVKFLVPGAAREIRLTGTALGGETPWALCSAQDVTEHRRAELALRNEIDRKDVFLATLSHEIRNPLAPIRSSLAVLAGAAPGGEQARRAEAVIDRQVTHLSHIVDDLLDVTRIARGKVHLQRERLDLAELVRQVIDDHRPGFELSAIQLEGDPASEPFWVHADRTRLAQVLGNLLGNALKFTPRGGKVEVLLHREDQVVALTVRDSGVGIAPEVRERLFEPFVQAPQSLDRTRGGLGLGLAMVKGLVEMHEGTVVAASSGAGKGAEFSVRLPLVEPAPSVAAPKSPQVHGRRRVLLIDDNVDAANTLQEMLELNGHDVKVAYDGPGGLAAARTFVPEIVLCDLGLPGMNGYEVARAFRADPGLRGAHLVVLSGYAQGADLRRASEAGFDEHVAKPASLARLEEILDKAPTDPSANALHGTARRS